MRLFSEVNNDLKLCVRSNFFTIESININNKICKIHLRYHLQLLVLSELKFRNCFLFLKLLLLLSGDINLNPGPDQIFIDFNDTYNPFKHRGLHFLHLNINSLVPKVDELRVIAKISNAAVIGISESKLDDSVLNPEVEINGYDLLRCDRNRHGGRIACYIRQDLCYRTRTICSKEIENLFFDILLPKSKPFTVSILYRPPNQNKITFSVSYQMG